MTFLVYKGDSELTVTSHSDVSYQTDRNDYKSQLGFMFCLNGSVVSWKSIKQSTVADFTIESKYITFLEVANKVIWVKKFVIELYCDKQ